MDVKRKKFCPVSKLSDSLELPCKCGSGKAYGLCHGTTLAEGPHPASVILGLDGSETKVVTRYAIINQMNITAQEIELSFDKCFQKRLAVLSDELAFTYGFILHGTEMASKLTDIQIQCYPLLFNAWNTLCGSLDLARRGYRLQPSILMRSVIECIAAGIYLLKNPHKSAEFQAGRIKTSAMIASAKSVFRPIGDHYGLYSNLFAHTSHIHRTPTVVDYYDEADRQSNHTLAFIRSANSMLHMTFELCFYFTIKEPVFWKNVGSNQFVLDPTPTAAERLDIIWKQ